MMTVNEFEKLLEGEQPKKRGRPKKVLPESPKGLSFCFTGTMSIPRWQLEDWVFDSGGSSKTTVTKDLDYLVCADKRENSSKIVQAKALKIQMITEEEFWQIAKRR